MWFLRFQDELSQPGEVARTERKEQGSGGTAGRVTGDGHGLERGWKRRSAEAARSQAGCFQPLTGSGQAMDGGHEWNCREIAVLAEALAGTREGQAQEAEEGGGDGR